MSRVFLFLSSGRCGTQWLAKSLAEVYEDLAVVTHEPIGPAYRGRTYFRQTERARELLQFPEVAAHLEMVERSLSQRTYIETGSPVFAAIPLFRERFDDVTVIQVARHPVSAAISLTTLGVFAGRDDDYMRLGVIDPYCPGVALPDYRSRWRAMSPFEKCLYWWTEIHLYGEELRRESSIPIHLFRYEDLFAPSHDSLESLIDVLGLPWREALGSAKAKRVDAVRSQTPIAFDWRAINRHPLTVELARRLDYDPNDVEPEKLRDRYLHQAAKRPPMSVVVPTRDRPELLAECLAHLRATLGPEDELLVVDSASRDVKVRQVTEEQGAMYLRCEQPGASRARNHGWRSARHELIAFVDDDVRVDSAWASALARCAAEYPEAAFVGGRIGTPPERPEYPLALKEDLDAAWLDELTASPIAHTANIAFHRFALERTGGFDELLGAGGKLRAAEDQDLFDRIFAAGFRGRYTPQAYAVHEPWRTRRDILALEWSYGIGSGARLVKLLTCNRGRVRKFMEENVWFFTRQLVAEVRARYKFMVAVSLVRLLGTMWGFVRTLPRPVRDGHLQGWRAALDSRQTNPTHWRDAPPAYPDET